jgi:transcriptional regulator with XRE-family HTH domain
MRNTPLGYHLRSQRAQHGLTLKECAERSGCSESYLCRIENGYSTPTDPVLLERIANAYGFGGDGLSTLAMAAHRSKSILRIPDKTSMLGHLVLHHVVDMVDKLDESTLDEIERIVAKATTCQMEEICPTDK